MGEDAEARNDLRKVLVEMKCYFRAMIHLNGLFETADIAQQKMVHDQTAMNTIQQLWEKYFPTDFTRELTRPDWEAAEQMLKRLMRTGDSPK